MAPIDSWSFDLTPYQSTPALSANALHILADNLYHATPSDPPAHVVKARKRMRATAGLVKHALIGRLGGDLFDLGAEAEFETTTDRLWSSTRDQVQLCIHYADPGFELLDEAQQASIDLDGKRELAGYARVLDHHLFGEVGLTFLQWPLREQVGAMATRLEFIATSPDHERYEAVIGSSLLATLRVLQDRYEAMVQDRAIREDSRVDLRSLRRVLQRHITAYATAMLSLLDEDEPESKPMVLTALRPMRHAREGIALPAAGADEAADVVEPAPAPVDDEPG